MGQHFVMHFARNGTMNPCNTGNDPAPWMTAAQRLEQIVQQGVIVATSQKGYFSNYRVPSVSFTGEQLERLGNFYNLRSDHALAFHRDRFPGTLYPVQYLTEQQLSTTPIPPEQLWLVDLVRPETRLAEDGSVLRRYDFRWEVEWRLHCSHINFRTDQVEFVLVPNQDWQKHYNEQHGVEAYPVDAQRTETSRYWAATGTLPAFEATFFEQWKQARAEGKSNPTQGRFAFPEILARTWDKIYADLGVPQIILHP